MLRHYSKAVADLGSALKKRFLCPALCNPSTISLIVFSASLRQPAALLKAYSLTFISFQAAEEPLQRLPGVFLKRASAWYAKMDISSLALLAGGLLDEMIEFVTPATTHAVSPPKAKVCAAHVTKPVCCRLLFIRSSAAGREPPLDLKHVMSGPAP